MKGDTLFPSTVEELVAACERDDVDIILPVSGLLDLARRVLALEASTHRRERYTIGDELLGNIAAVYEREGFDGVHETFGRSRAQTYRLIGLARKAGLIA
jgi:hypothetical protein